MDLRQRERLESKLFKLALTETIYDTWAYNGACFRKPIDKAQVVENIIEKIVYRSLFCKDLKSHIVCFMAS